MYIRKFTDGGVAPTCPSGWQTSPGGALPERMGSSFSNYVARCYDETLRCQVIDIKKNINEAISDITDPKYEGATYDPPACPSGFSAATTTTAHAGLSTTIYANRIRVCYKCY